MQSISLADVLAIIAMLVAGISGLIVFDSEGADNLSNSFEKFFFHLLGPFSVAYTSKHLTRRGKLWMTAFLLAITYLLVWVIL